VSGEIATGMKARGEAYLRSTKKCGHPWQGVSPPSAAPLKETGVRKYKRTAAHSDERTERAGGGLARAKEKFKEEAVR